MSELKKKRDIRRRYDLTAHMYDMRYAEEQAAKIKAALNTLNIKKQGQILDAGCGTGILFEYVAENTEATVGLDISRAILLQAKKRARKFGRVHLILADADNMPLRANAFNHVFGVTILQNMPYPAKTLSEFKRVAKNNGFIIVTGMKKAFTLQQFEELLRDSGLKIASLKDEGLKCYVAVCTRLHP